MSGDGSNKNRDPQKWYHYVLWAENNYSASNGRSYALWTAWFLLGCIGISWLLFMNVILYVPPDVTIVDMLTSWIFLPCVYSVVLAVIGIPMRWGFTIPLMLLGYLVAPFFAAINGSALDDYYRSLVFAAVGGVIGIAIDRSDSSDATPSDPPPG